MSPPGRRVLEPAAGGRLLVRGHRLKYIATLTVLLLAASLRAQDRPDAVERIRLHKTARSTVSLKADRISTWNDPDERVYLLVADKSKSMFDQNLRQVWAEQIVVWERAEGFGAQRTYRLTVFAPNKPRLELDGKSSSPASVLIETETDQPIDLGRSPEVEPSRDHPAYRAGMAARKKSIPVADKPGPVEVAANPPPLEPLLAIEPAARVKPEEIRPAVVRPGDQTPVTPAAMRLQPERDPPLAPPAGGGVGPDDKKLLPAPSKSFQIETPLGTELIPLVNPTRPKISIGPRGQRFQIIPGPLTNGQQMLIIVGGVRVTGEVIQNKTTKEKMVLDLEADRAVYWRSSPLPQGSAANGEPEFSAEDGDVNEFYLAGNVIFRYGSTFERKNLDGTPLEPRTIRADEVYYNAATLKAVARNADVELGRPSLPQPAHVKTRELWLLSPDEYKAFDPEISASALPSDPGLKLTFREADIVRRKAVRTNVFGVPFFDRLRGQEVEATETTFEGKRLFVELGDVPVFYLPYLAGDVRRPLGPLNNLSFRQDRYFGSQIYTTWSMFELLALKPLPGEKWTLDLDYLSKRGPGVGTNYTYTNAQDPDSPYKYRGSFLFYGLQDHSDVFLGGIRPQSYTAPAFRDRFLFRHQQELTDDLDVQAQVAFLSDRNFLEQFYKYEFDQGPNQETFVHAKYRRGPMFLSAYAQPYFYREFANEVNWLPKAEGAWLGQSVFDLATYHAWGSAGYAEQRQVNVLPPPVLATETPPVQAGRFDLMQELLVPIQAGPVKITPYGKIDTALYTEDRRGNQNGRFYGGLGTKAALPFSRLYEDVSSDVFNLKGLNHKVTLTANYYSARSDSRFNEFPLLDRIYDDATDQARRDFLPFERFFVKGQNGLNLQNVAPIYDPQRYLIRRQVDIHPESLDNLQVMRVGANQRFQTKRGYPGLEHTVDFFSSNFGISYFPQETRDNFGKPLGLIDYDMTLFLGDRTSVHGDGWIDPFQGGARYYSVGGSLSRPDNTSLTLDYIHIDPLGSRQVVGSVGYIFNAKYSARAYGNYDFGVKNNWTVGTVITRKGTDLSMSLGFNYSAIINNFGVVFELVPNLIASRGQGLSSGGLSQLGGQRR